MRYFRYQNTNKNINNALKARYRSLTEDEKRTYRREKCWRRISTVVSFLVFFSCTVSGFLLIRKIPLPQDWLLKVLAAVGKGMLGLVLLIAGGVLTAFLTNPLWKKADSFCIPPMKKEIFSKACGHLREYYGLKEPYIVTKCLDATDRKFRNHDVCVFVAGDELRITTDLVRGFLHGERDLGCYAFIRNEVSLSKQQQGNRLIAELRADDKVFLLGYRAKGFIEKNFLTEAAPDFDNRR